MEDKLEITPEGLRIPIIPAGVAELIEALSNDELDFEELGDYLKRFPGIVARLIALANSAWSAPAQEITTLENAVSRLGLKVSRSIAIALAVSAPLDTHRCPSFNSVHYWCDALLVADIAGLIAAESEHEAAPDPSTCRVAGLIHNIGLLVLVDNFPDRMDDCFQAYAKLPGSRVLNDLLTAELGFSTLDIGGRIAQSWGLPGVFEKTMSSFSDTDYRDDYWPVVNLVSASIEITSQLNEGAEAAPDYLKHDEGLFDRELVQRKWDSLKALRLKVQALAEQVFAK